MIETVQQRTPALQCTPTQRTPALRASYVRRRQSIAAHTRRPAFALQPHTQAPASAHPPTSDTLRLLPPWQCTRMPPSGAAMASSMKATASGKNCKGWGEGLVGAVGWGGVGWGEIKSGL